MVTPQTDTPQTELEPSDPVNGALSRIIAQRERFLSFLVARVEDAATAEDILQSAYVKAVEHGS